VYSSGDIIKVSNTTVYNTEVIYAQAIALKQTKDLGADSLVAHKLAPLPPSTFKEAGEIIDAKTKSILKKSVKIEFSEQSATRRLENSHKAGGSVIQDGNKNCTDVWKSDIASDCSMTRGQDKCN